MSYRHGYLQRPKDRHEFEDILTREQEFDMPVEWRDTGGEFGYLVELEGHTTLVVHVEPNSASSPGFEVRDLLVFKIHCNRHDSAGLVRSSCVQ